MYSYILFHNSQYELPAVNLMSYLPEEAFLPSKSKWKFIN